MYCSSLFNHACLQYIFAIIVTVYTLNVGVCDEIKDDSETKAIRYEYLTCTKLRDLSDHIMKKLDETVNKSYEGGNPEWINQNLPSYEISELRFMDVFDGSCDMIPNPTNCHELYQEHEKDMYDWFINHKDSNKPIYDELFVEKLKLCCGKNQYGPDCDTCKVVSEDGNVCGGRGECKGEYTRMGDGTCECQNSYLGDECEICAPRTFRESDGQCQSCHIACKNGCTAFSESACVDNECTEGYEPIGETGCKKIDYCANQTLSNCGSDEFCVNLNLKFECRKCDKSCNGCTGPTNKDCNTCADGFAVGDRSCDKIRSKRSKYRFVQHEGGEDSTKPNQDEQNVKATQDEKPSKIEKQKKKDKKSKKDEKISSKDYKIKNANKKGDKQKAEKKSKDHKKKDKKSKLNKQSKKKEKINYQDLLYDKSVFAKPAEDIFDEL